MTNESQIEDLIANPSDYRVSTKYRIENIDLSEDVDGEEDTQIQAFLDVSITPKLKDLLKKYVAPVAGGTRKLADMTILGKKLKRKFVKRIVMAEFLDTPDCAIIYTPELLKTGKLTIDLMKFGNSPSITAKKLEDAFDDGVNAVGRVEIMLHNTSTHTYTLTIIEEE